LPKVEKSGRAPSWKAIAVCILKNDLHLTGLGFTKDDNDLCHALKREMKEKRTGQRGLF